MNEDLRNRIALWHQTNGGGLPGESHLAFHALRMLREAVELCLACGAWDSDIMPPVEEEIQKHLQRRGLGAPDLDSIRDEFADVAILLETFRRLADIDEDLEVSQKVDTLEQRSWVADHHGVLWRPYT